MLKQTKSILAVTSLKALIHCWALYLLIELYWLAFQDSLGADPVEYVLHFTGIGALNLLLLTLCASPLAKLTKKSLFMKIRRLIGLYAFTYAFAHFISFIAFELQFDGALLLSEIIKRPYITVGALALILLIALAVTSINALKRRMGKNWQRLHSSIYLIVLLGLLHFYWSVKSDVFEPLVYFFIVMFLLLLRKQKIKQWLNIS